VYSRENEDGTIFSHFLVYTKPQTLSNSQTPRLGLK